MSTEYRIEHDTMGEVRVPKDALYAAQTQRAVENFPISGRPLSSHHIAALAHVRRPRLAPTVTSVCCPQTSWPPSATRPTA